MEERAQSRTCLHSCCVCAYPVSLESLSVSGLIQFTYLRNLLELLLSSARYSFPSILPNLTNLPINWDWNGRLGQGLIYIPGSAPLELDCQPLPTFLSRLVCIFCPFFSQQGETNIVCKWGWLFHQRSPPAYQLDHRLRLESATEIC